MTIRDLSQVVQQKYVNLLMENAPLCFLVVDEDRTVVYANEYMRSFLTPEQGEPVGQKCYALCGYSAPCKDCVLDQCVAAMEEKELFRSEVPRFNSIQYCDIVDVPLLDSGIDPDQKKTLFMEIVFDRTQEIELEKKLEQDFDTTVDTLAYILSVQESEVAKSNDAIAKLAVGLGGRMGLTPAETKELRVAALLHNLGKISLYKMNEPENTEQGERTPSYAELSARTLKSIDRMKGIAKIIRFHLANYDGSGEPCETSGDEIPLASAVLRLSIMALDFLPGVADLEALDAGSANLLLQLFSARSGTVFAPQVIESFRKAVGL